MTSASLRIPLLVGFAAWGAGWAYSQQPALDPLQERACASCHLSSAGSVVASNAHLLVAPQEQLCATCHPGARDASHPSGLQPSFAFPAEFPLDWKGDLTCSTCHNIHQGGHGRSRSDLTGKPYCQRCHEQGFFASMPDEGSSLVSSGHLDALSDPEQSALDPYSVQCLGCHEDRGDLGMHVDPGGVARHSAASVNHPIGNLYADAISFGGYRPQAQLSASIPLPAGKVSCISCHQGYSQAHGELVESNNGLDLCFQCHDL